MKMKAIVYKKYGPPDVLRLNEVEKPIPKDNEVLVKVYASSVNVEDLDYLTGKPWAVRMIGLLKPKYKTLGFDVAGRVEAIGKDVKEFQCGDARAFINLSLSRFETVSPFLGFGVKS